MTKTDIWEEARSRNYGMDFLKKLDSILCSIKIDKKTTSCKKCFE